MSITRVVSAKEIFTEESKLRFKVLIAIFCFTGSLHIANAQSNTSIYTSLDTKQCRTLKSSSAEGGSYEGRCKDVGGFWLLLSEGDLRQNVTVVSPRGAKVSLDLWSVVSGGFSTVGARAEWRVRTEKKHVIPVALIIRFNASEDSAHPDRLTSYLAVAKITSMQTCVTAKFAPGPNANVDARKAADGAADKPCLSAND